MQTLKNGASSAFDAVFEYDTPKVVHIKNKKVGLINRLVQVIIIGYIVGYAIVYQRGYNTYEDVLSAVTTKVVGIGFTDADNPNETNAGTRVWDSSDFVIPPQSPNSVFIMTNMWVTDQRQGICAETKYQNCTNDTMCSNGTRTVNGVLTGVCDLNVSKCLAYAWCPIEQENKTITNSGPKLPSAVNYTIFIKNSIQFPLLASKFRKRNVKNFKDGCRFNFKNESYGCPIFSVSQIIDMLENDYSFDDLATFGSVLGLRINWDCNLDRDSSHCNPVYSARRIDDPSAVNTKGFNFRFANPWMGSDGVLTRQLIKAYGIRIDILVTGQGGKFSPTALIIKLGSGIALLAVASVVSDIFILYVLRQKDYYRKKKYLNVVAGASLFQDAVALNPKEAQPLLGTQSGDESEGEGLPVTRRKK